MGEVVSAVNLANAMQTFVGYVDDLARIQFDGSSTKLRLVINYASRDYTVRPLTETLRSYMPAAEVLERVSGETIDAPAAGVKRLAFLFDLLVQLKSGFKVSLRQLLSRSEFSPGDMDRRWGAFQKGYVIPLRDLLDAVRAELAQLDGDHEPHEAFRNALGAVFGDAPPPAAKATEPRETAELTALDAAVRGASLTRARERDLLVDVSILEVELRKTQPDAARLAELVETLGGAGSAIRSAAEACLPGGVAVAPAPAPAPKPAPTPKAAPANPAPAAPAPASEDLSAERQQLEADRQQLAAEREAFEAERDAEREAIAAQRKALEAERKALEAKRRALGG